MFWWRGDKFLNLLTLDSTQFGLPEDKDPPIEPQVASKDVSFPLPCKVLWIDADDLIAFKESGPLSYSEIQIVHWKVVEESDDSC